MRSGTITRAFVLCLGSAAPLGLFNNNSNKNEYDVFVVVSTRKYFCEYTYLFQ